MEGMQAVFRLWLLLGGVCVASGSTVNILEQTYKVARGDNVTIPCQITPPPTAGSAPVIFWTATPDKAGDPSITVVTYTGPTNVKVGKKYKGRASLIHDLSKGQANLQLSGVISSDTRTYECKWEIADEDDPPADTTNLIVLVAPSVPVCTINGKQEYFEDITLSCRSEEGTPTPTYKWQIYDVNNASRPLPPKATDLNGVLSLYNITKDTSGYYTCTSTNEIRSARCSLTMAVMPPSINMASMGGIIGVVAGVALLVIIIIICCCCYRRRKQKEAEAYAMGSPEGGEYTDRDPDGKEEHVNYEEERRLKSPDRAQDERSERSYDHRSDYDDRTDRRDDRDDRYDDRRDRRDRDDDRRDRYDDRRERDDDRRDRYDDRRDRSDDRRDRYDDRRDRSDDRRDRNDYQRDRYDDRRDRYDDRYDSDRYDSRDRPPSVPPGKPKDPRN